MQAINPNQTKPKYEWLTRLLFYLIPLVMGLIYWLTFYPGVMSFDSVSAWNQLTNFTIYDHPAAHTILEWLLTRIWYSPAIISLFQIFITSLVIGYGLGSIYTASRLPGYIFIGLSFLLSANPLVGVMDVTLWKDVLYSFSILLLTIIIFNLIRSDGEWINRSGHIVLLGISLASVWLFRFNGAPVVIASLIILPIIYKKNFRRLAYSALITIILIVFITGPVYTWFKVDRATRLNYGVSFIHPVAAYVSSQTSLDYLSNSEKSYLNRIYPLDKTWLYSCYDATVFYYNYANFNPVMEDPLSLVKIFAKMAVNNPKIAFNHYLCLSSFVWQPNQPENVYLESILLDNYNLEFSPAWKVYENAVTQRSLLPEFRNLVQRAVNATWSREALQILWRPAIYMYLFLGSVLFYVFRKRQKKWLLLMVPLLVQTIGIMFTTPLQALRYQYPVYIISMMFTIPFIAMGTFKPPVDQAEINSKAS